MTGNALADALGPDFERLDPLIQAAHRGRIRLSGTVEVKRGRGVGGWLAGILKMPASNPACAMVVEGDHQPDVMLSSRDFAGRKMVSAFRRDGAYLTERMGPIALRLKPFVENGSLVYRLISARIGFLPIPAFLQPRLAAWERETDNLYDFEVDIGLHVLGRLIRYRGRLRLESSNGA